MKCMHCTNKKQCEAQEIEHFMTEEADLCAAFDDDLKVSTVIDLIEPKVKKRIVDIHAKKKEIKDKIEKYILKAVDSKLTQLNKTVGSEFDTLSLNKMKLELNYLLALEAYTQVEETKPEDRSESRAGILQQLNKSVELHGDLDGMGKYGVGAASYKGLLTQIGMTGVIGKKQKYLPDNKEEDKKE